MATSVKISQLLDGGNIQGQDQVPVARGTETYRIRANQLITDGVSVGNGTPVYGGKTTGESTRIQIRSLSGTDGITVVNQGNTLVVTASGQNPVKTKFFGNGTTKNFAVTQANSVNANNYRIDIDGVLQEPGEDYTIEGTNVKFTTAPPLSSKVVVVSNNLVRAYDIVPSDGSVTVPKLGTDVLSALTPPPPPLSFRNKIINGDMRIDQRNAGVAITSNTAYKLLYSVDRFFVVCNCLNPFLITSQRVTDSSNPQFSDYFRTTTTTGANFTGTAPELGQYNIQQRIEGFNLKDFKFGTPQAKTLTLSFWVRSNYIGTYLISFQNGDNLSRLYMASYQINQINTWEKKTVTIPGDTTGSWLTDNQLGLAITWGLGSSNIFYTSGGYGLNSWNNFGITANPRPDININNTVQSLHNKTGAYFDLTGVQLEEGPVATPFEQRPIGLELSLCQRYYETGYQYDSRFGNAIFASGGLFWATNEIWTIYKVTKRTTPAITLPWVSTGSGANVSTIFIGPTTTVSGYGTVQGTYLISVHGFIAAWAPYNTGTDAAPWYWWTADAEL